MITMPKLEACLARYPVAAVAAYVALVLLFVFTTVQTSIEILSSRDAAAASAEILQTLEARHPAPRAAARSEAGGPTGSPFLEGQTASVAGSILLQRVLAATKRVGGNTLSSQVDIQGPQAKAGFVSATFNIELASASLQALLYDLEAGMPFLFVDELVVQPVASNPEKMRVVVGISAQRRSAK